MSRNIQNSDRLGETYWPNEFSRSGFFINGEEYIGNRFTLKDKVYTMIENFSKEVIMVRKIKK